MRSTYKSRRSIGTFFHEDELARMKHTHELMRPGFTPRRNQVTNFMVGRIELPPLKLNKALPSTLPERNGAARLHRRLGAVPAWKDTLRQGILATVKLPLLGARDQSSTNKANRIDATLATILSTRAATTSEIKSDALNWSEDAVCLTNHEEPMQTTVETPPLDAAVKSKEERAVETLERLFLPCWRLYMHLKKLRTKPVKVYKGSVRVPSRRRRRVNDVAIEVIRAFLCNGWRLPLMEFRRWKGEVVKIQRVFRRHKLCVDARVELNYRKVRAELEQAYWEKVAEAHEQALEDGLARNDDNSEAEMGVANFFLVGPLPEVFLRRELRSALYLQEYHLLQESSEQPDRTFFLPTSTCYAVLDNVCYITSVVRSSQILQSHLLGREKKIAAY
ncbi:uncharacterized protein Tco025E_07064 [Trypanosoma conorhini]|uniref:Uncharacterized protein n=1 Tax=Trypanosoma conorhini TaxID=83891 RepID=A0A3R7MNX3_9TRYP|nr:uncharacterized protein Tco025E_07064 [Trypanosoma conorhini]RNF08941.1 hypothetical protein Tco025E_07064 [Trypanosoma conorhini]